MLPDPLQRLQAQYQQLVTDVQNDNLTFEQAQQNLTHMVTVDGAGQQWSIDINGQFTMTADPARPGQPTDPSEFQAAELPARPGSEELPPWADSHLMGDPPASGGPVGGAPWPGGHGGGTLPATLPSPTGRPKHLGDNPDDSLATRVKATAGKLTGPLSAITNKVPARTLAIVGIGLVALFVLFIYGRMADDPLDDSGPFGGPVTDLSDNGEEGDGTDARDDGRDIADTDGDTDGDTGGGGSDGGDGAELPAGAVVDEVVSAVTSGDRDLAASKLANPGDEVDIALLTGTLSGLEVADLVVNTDPAGADEDGGIAQRWELADARDGTVYATATVAWVRADESDWQLTTWPNFTPDP